MITETYKGRKIRIVKGRGTDWGYSRVKLNGVDLGTWQGDESKVQGRIRGSIDGVDTAGGINGDKYGAEWYAPGTFEVCENGHPKEIGGECLHSYCIERRPVAATESARTPNTIRISDRMAEALTGTALTEDGKTIRLTSRVRAGTTCALMNRGLVEYNRELTRENGYEVHTLTPRGMNVRERLLAQPGAREFLSSVVDAAARKAGEESCNLCSGQPHTGPCDWMGPDPTEIRKDQETSGNANVREVSKALKAAGFTPCNPERGGSRSGYKASQQGPRVRVTWREGADTDMMGDQEREATRDVMNDSYASALETAGYPVEGRIGGFPAYVSGPKTRTKPAVAGLSKAPTVAPVTEYSVKIWYRSGAYEGVAHSPEDLARKIYADAVESAGVEFAELHGPSGKLVESKTPEKRNG